MGSPMVANGSSRPLSYRFPIVTIGLSEPIMQCSGRPRQTDRIG